MGQRNGGYPVGDAGRGDHRVAPSMNWDLLTVALLAGVSVSQSRDVEARIIHTEVVTLPAVLQLHELARSGQPVRSSFQAVCAS